MPTITTPRSTINRASLEELRENRNRQRADERQAAALSSLEWRVRWYLERLLARARSYRESEAARALDAKVMSEMAEEDPRLADRSSAGLVRALVRGPVALLAIALIDVALLGGAAQFLVSLVYSFGDGAQPLWPLLAIVPALLGFELFVSDRVAAEAKQHARLEPGQPRAFSPSRAIAWGLAITVPALAAATFLQSNDVNNSASVSGLLGLGLIVLAACVHGTVLLYGARSLESISFVSNQRKFWRYERAANAAVNQSRRLRDESRDELRGYHGAIASFRTAANGEMSPSLQISDLDAVLVNEAVGAEVVRVSTANAAAEGPRPPSNLGEAAPRSTDGQQPTSHPDDTESPVAAAEDVSEHLEYLRRIIRGRQADADGEIT